MTTTIKLKELTTKELEKAILSSDENALRELLISKFDEATEQGVNVDGFYYAYYVALSDEIFDMFCLSGLESLFSLHGFNVEWKETGKDEHDCIVGLVTVKKGDFSFEMICEESMHDSLISMFVDTKTAKITSGKSPEYILKDLLDRNFEPLIEVVSSRLEDYNEHCAMYEENHQDSNGIDDCYREGYGADLEEVLNFLREVNDIKTKEKMITCPSCGVDNTEKLWNKNTAEIVRGLNDDNFPIATYAEREEGTAFRCPNPDCEDEVITDKDGVLRTQDGEGDLIIG